MLSTRRVGITLASVYIVTLATNLILYSVSFQFVESQKESYPELDDATIIMMYSTVQVIELLK